MVPSVVEKDQAKILLDFQIQMDKFLMANQVDILVLEKQRKKAIVIDVAIPDNSNIRRNKRSSRNTKG